MKSIGQLFIGLITAIASSLIVLSATMLSAVEGQTQLLPALPTDTPPVFFQETTIVNIVDESTPIPPPQPSSTPSCAYPEGWVAYIILNGDSLESLAEKSGTTVENLYTGNCLEGKSLVISAKLYLPPTPSITPTETSKPNEDNPEPPTPTPTLTPTTTTGGAQCPPPGWIRYVVKAGDNLYRIGLAYGVTVNQLMAANCLSSDRIRAGQIIFVPNVTPRFPTNTSTPTEPPPPPKPTQKPSPLPTAEPTAEPTLEPTEEPTEEPTAEPTAAAPTEEPTDSYPPPSG